MRADVYLTLYKHTESRNKAAEYIKNGMVAVDFKKIEKPSEEIDEGQEHTVEINLRDDDKYVGRGALKLKSAFEIFGLSAEGRVCIDIGASTGGFTDYLLQNGAGKVFAVDSGHGQLHQRLANDPRVISKEGLNARYIKIDDIGEAADIIVIDVSFISQTLIIPSLVRLLHDKGIVITLVKPQFEAGKEALGKNGIVKKPESKLFAIERVTECAVKEGLCPVGLIKSPIKGGDGNEEYLIYFSRNGEYTADKVAEFRILAKNTVK